MVMKKRGLSDVVTTSLIVLLAIAAVVIVWQFVLPVLKNTGTQMQGTDCLSVSLKPIACTINVGSLDSVRVEAGTGSLTIPYVRVLVYDSAGNTLSSEQAGNCFNLAPLDVKMCTTTYDILVGAGNKVAVAAILVNNMTCAASSQITC